MGIAFSNHLLGTVQTVPDRVGIGILREVTRLVTMKSPMAAVGLKGFCAVTVTSQPSRGS
jgi:hypothetical protein